MGTLPFLQIEIKVLFKEYPFEEAPRIIVFPRAHTCPYPALDVGSSNSNILTGTLNLQRGPYPQLLERGTLNRVRVCLIPKPLH